MSRECFVLTIDGPGGSGKSTTAKRVADELGLAYLDTGALYRVVGLAALRDGIALDDASALGALASSLEVVFVDGGRGVVANGEDVSVAIRLPEVSDAASRASAHVPVRKALVALQRGAAVAPGLVAEGRDMGTVIFPDADLKIFLEADAEERARRRAAELSERGEHVDVESVLADLVTRDARDSGRDASPLEIAEDAIRIDSTESPVDDVVRTIVNEARKRRGGQ